MASSGAATAAAALPPRPPTSTEELDEFDDPGPFLERPKRVESGAVLASQLLVLPDDAEEAIVLGEDF